MLRNSDDAIIPADGLFDDEFNLFADDADSLFFNPELSSLLHQPEEELVNPELPPLSPQLEDESASKKRPRDAVENPEDHPAKKRKIDEEKKAETDDASYTKKLTVQKELIRQLKAEKCRLERKIKSDRYSFEAEKSSLQTQLVFAKAGTAPQYQSKQDLKIKSENTTLKVHLMSHKKRVAEFETETALLKQQLSQQAEIIKTLRTEKEATQTSTTSPQWQYHYLACTPRLFSSSTLPEITSPMTEGEHQHLGPK